MKWYVYIYNINSKKMEVYNIFDHASFKFCVEKELNNCNSKEDFAYKINNELKYYFWSKAEWEIIISPWIGADGVKNKIDIYDQVINNWQVFVDYCWSFKK